MGDRGYGIKKENAWQERRRDDLGNPSLELQSAEGGWEYLHRPHEEFWKWYVADRCRDEILFNDGIGGCIFIRCRNFVNLAAFIIRNVPALPFVHVTILKWDNLICSMSATADFGELPECTLTESELFFISSKYHQRVGSNFWSLQDVRWRIRSNFWFTLSSR